MVTKAGVPAELLSSGGTEAIALQDYSAQELAVRPGEAVVVEEKRHGWLLVRNVNKEPGWIGASHIDPQAT